LAQQKKTRKVGRPKLPKGEAKGAIVPVRFAANDLKKIDKAAKQEKQTLSEWIRRTVVEQEKDEWTKVRDDGKKVKITCQQVGPGRAIMTAEIEGEAFKRWLEKTGIPIPLSREDVEREFHSVWAES